MIKSIELREVVKQVGNLLTKIEQKSNNLYEITVANCNENAKVGDFSERTISKIIPVAEYTDGRSDTRTLEGIAKHLVKSEPRNLRDVSVCLKHYHSALGLKVDKYGLKVYQEELDNPAKVEAIIAKIELEPYGAKPW